MSHCRLVAIVLMSLVATSNRFFFIGHSRAVVPRRAGAEKLLPTDAHEGGHGHQEGLTGQRGRGGLREPGGDGKQVYTLYTVRCTPCSVNKE